MSNPFSLENKTVLVTGASSGIGRACACACAAAGARIIATGRDATRLGETLSSLHSFAACGMGGGQQHLSVPADLTDAEEPGIQKIVASVPAPLDGIVHCAGINERRPFAFTSRERFLKIFDVNFFAPAELSRLLLKARKISSGGASIVFISSIDGPKTAHVANNAYAASKGAVSALAKSMAVELAAQKIRVNAILPGMVETPLIHSGEISEDQLAQDRARYPLKRYGKPEEIAGAAVYLLSDAAAWTTGAELVIDGGFSLL